MISNPLGPRTRPDCVAMAAYSPWDMGPAMEVVLGLSPPWIEANGRYDVPCA